MLEDTGERIIPEHMSIFNELLLEHIARYHFSAPHAYGRVLDVACGSGYGTHIIAKRCKTAIDEIIGVDNDDDALAYARGTYYHPLSSFHKGDVTDSDLPEQLQTFDVILSFETIEHIDAEQQFLDNMDAMLKPGGTLVLSTPFGQGRGVKSGQAFHVHQLTPAEFKNLFTAYDQKRFYGQKGALIEPSDFQDNQPTHPLGIALCQKSY